MEFLLFAVFVAVVWLIAIWAEGRRRYRLLAEVLEEMEQLEKQVVPAKLEIHHDCFYLFHCDTDEFLAQGRTAQDLMTHMEQRFRGSTVKIQEGDRTQIARLKQEVTTAQNKVAKLDEVANASPSID